MKKILIVLVIVTILAVAFMMLISSGLLFASPERTVKRYVSALEKNDYQTMYKCYHPDMQNGLDDFETIVDNIPKDIEIKLTYKNFNNSYTNDNFTDISAAYDLLVKYENKTVDSIVLFDFSLVKDHFKWYIYESYDVRLEENYDEPVINSSAKDTDKDKNENSIDQVSLQNDSSALNSSAPDRELNINDIEIIFSKNKFANVNGYGEGLYAVQDIETGLWGYVDRYGEYVIRPEYFEAYSFCEGLAGVQRQDGYFDFIDRNNKVVLDLDISCILWDGSNDRGFKNNHAIVRFDNANGVSLINKYGEIVHQFENHPINRDTLVLSERLMNGEVYIYKEESVAKIFNEEYNSIFQGKYKSNNISHHVSNYGLIPSVRLQSYNFSTKYAIVENEDCIYLVDKDGNIIFDSNTIKFNPDDDYLHLNDYHIAHVKNNFSALSTAVYDFNGNLVIDYQPLTLTPITENLFIAVNNAEATAIVDKELNEIVPFSYGIDIHDFNKAYVGDHQSPSFGFSIARNFIEYEYTDSSGKKYYKILNCSSEEIDDFSTDNLDIVNNSELLGDSMRGKENNTKNMIYYSMPYKNWANPAIFFANGELIYEFEEKINGYSLYDNTTYFLQLDEEIGRKVVTIVAIDY